MTPQGTHRQMSGSTANALTPEIKYSWSIQMITEVKLVKIRNYFILPHTGSLQK